MFEILAPAIRILVMAAFLRLATMGYLTPEDASELTKVVVDLLVFGGPVVYAWWAARQVAKAKRQ